MSLTFCEVNKFLKSPLTAALGYLYTFTCLIMAIVAQVFLWHRRVISKCRTRALGLERLQGSLFSCDIEAVGHQRGQQRISRPKKHKQLPPSHLSTGTEYVLWVTEKFQ